MIPSAAQILIDRLHERATIFKAVSFDPIGFVNTTIDFGVFSFGCYVLGLPIVANLLSRISAVSASYVMKSMITFSVESGRELTVKTDARLAGGFCSKCHDDMPVLFGRGLATGISFFFAVALRRVQKQSAGTPRE